MKIGVYGGAFNPPHLGHITAARAVFGLLKLDKLLVIPTGHPPHKALPSESPAPEQRLEMTRLAMEQTGLGDKAEVLDLELRRGGNSYTADTLACLKEKYPADELWLLMGADMFLTLHTWHEPERILSLAGVAAFGRTEADMEELFSVQRDFLCRRFPQARIFTLSIPGVVDVSSTELRERLARGEGGGLLAPAVYGYILREKLYGTAADLKNLSLEQLRPVALSCLNHRRIPHVLGTEQVPSAWRSAGGRTRRRPGGPLCFTTARRSRASRSSWPWQSSSTFPWTRWSGGKSSSSTPRLARASQRRSLAQMRRLPTPSAGTPPGGGT